MAIKQIMPKLGLTMVKGTLIKWLKCEGDAVTKNEPLVEIQSDKSSFEIEASGSGILRRILCAEGEEIAVGEIIAIIGEADEEIKGITAKNESIPEKTLEYDIGVIGGGPGGYVAAIKAAQLGAQVVLFEKETLGGVCLNKGCIPTKTLLKSAKMLKQIKEAEGFAIEGIDADRIKINLFRLQERKREIVKQLTSGVGGLLKANGIAVINEKANLIEPSLIQAGGRKYKVSNVIIATGSKPRIIPIPGIESPQVITSDEALSLTKIPDSITILGGGVIGIEFAIVFNQLGTRVTVVEMMDRILPTIDEEVAAELKMIMEQEGIVIHTGTVAQSIEENKLFCKKETDDWVVESETILVAVGRIPDYSSINIDKLGLKVDKGSLVTDEKMLTNIPGIYAIGDVNGKVMLAHVASAEGIVAVENILGQETKMKYNFIPQCIYSFPEIASVGLTEKEARERFNNVKAAKFPFTANGKALIEGERSGFVKIITNENYKEVLGVHIIGPAATDIISEAVLALNLECTADELVKVIHPHPTNAESLLEAFHAANNKSIHFISQ